MREIEAGEEIVYAYNANAVYLAYEERQPACLFKCTCEACTPGTRLHELTEVRRPLLRALHFLARG
jgi:hypothetical protein